MRVLWVTPHHPAPREGGAALHEFELIRSVASMHEVSVVCSMPAGQTIPELEDLVTDVVYVPWKGTPPPRGRLEWVWRLLTKDVATTAWLVGDMHQVMRDAVRRQLDSRPADLVHVVMGEAAPVIATIDAPVALLLFDVFTRHESRRAERIDGVLSRSLRRLQMRKVRTWERRWYAGATSVACVSSRDAEVVRELLHRDVSVIPNPIPETYFDEPTVPRSVANVSYIAALDYHPNIEALRWFAEAVWPLVSRSRPDARLKVVGWKPTAEVQTLTTSAGGELHPNVDDVRVFYWDAAVAVAPIRLGAGMRNKVLHAMACGAPVVATHTAVEGVECADGVHALLRDDPAAFAAAIVATLDDQVAAAERVHNARELAEGFRAEAIGLTLSRWWEATLARSAAVTG